MFPLNLTLFIRVRVRHIILLSALAVLSLYYFNGILSLNFPLEFNPVCVLSNRICGEKQEDVQACQIPEFDLYHASIKHLFKEPDDPNCTTQVPLLFNSTLKSELVPVLTLDQFYSRGIRSCCYRVVFRDRSSDNPSPDFGYSFSRLCYPISLKTTTMVPAGHEFVAIYCRNDEGHDTPSEYIPATKEFADLFAFVHLKPEVEKILGNTPPPGESRMNVAIFGLDAVSRANFLRSMPESHKYLVDVMNAIEMKGYNKVADNTLPNLIALLTSSTKDKLMQTCVKNKVFDECPFIWKEFARKGYRTGFVEDSSNMALFNRYGYQGFNRPPTNYYLRHFGLLANDLFRPLQNDTLICQGHRLFLETLLDYLSKFSFKMNEENKSFFLFSWEGSLTHDDVNMAKLADVPLKRTLQGLHENSQLNNTLLVLMSDHGMRFGEIKNYRPGQLEDRLPFMYFVLPQWFKTVYPRAYENLRGNARRFVNTLDLHFVLKDLLKPEDIRDEKLLQREHELDTLFKNSSNTTVPKGISLFLPIPPSRTCKHTMIDPTFCICSRFESVSVHGENVKDAAMGVIRDMNIMTSGYPVCARLTMTNISMVRRRLNSETQPAYLINFKTEPGGGEFEALAVKDSPSFYWKLSDGVVVRTNLYGNQSRCVTHGDIIQFCYCKANTDKINGAVNVLVLKIRYNIVSLLITLIPVLKRAFIILE